MKEKSNNNIIKSLVLLYAYLALFVFIYRPNLESFIGINGNILALLLATPILLKVLLAYRKHIRVSRYFAAGSLLLIVASLYSAVRGLIAGEYINNIVANSYKILILIPYGIVAYSMIVNMASIKKEQDTRSVAIEALIMVGLVQSLIAATMLFIPQLREIAKTIYYNGNSENIYISASRLFGICDGDYTYGLQILHSILASISIVYAYYSGKKKYYAYSLLILTTTFLNGRTGLIIFVANTVLFIIIQLCRRGQIKKVITALAILLALIPIAVWSIKEMAPKSYHNIEVMLSDIRLSNKGRGDTETEAYRDMLVLPTGLDLLTGSGIRIYGHNGIKFGIRESSDVGFVNDVYIGGIIYCLLLMFAFLLYTKIMKKNSFEGMLLVVIIASFVLGNLKGEFIRQPLLASAMLYIIAFLIWEKKNETKNIGHSTSL